MQYTVINAHTPEILVEKIEGYLKTGWAPQGGISVTNAATIIYAQALVKN